MDPYYGNANSYDEVVRLKKENQQLREKLFKTEKILTQYQTRVETLEAKLMAKSD